MDSDNSPYPDGRGFVTMGTHGFVFTENKSPLAGPSHVHAAPLDEVLAMPLNARRRLFPSVAGAHSEDHP